MLHLVLVSLYTSGGLDLSGSSLGLDLGLLSCHLNMHVKDLLLQGVSDSSPIKMVTLDLPVQRRLHTHLPSLETVIGSYRPHFLRVE